MREIHLIKLIVVTIVGLVREFALMAKKRRSEGWPIIGGRFETGYTSDEYGMVAELGYSYAPNGEFFSGFYRREFRLQSSAEHFLHFVQGQQVLIRYEPECPQNSIVREQDNPFLLRSL